MGEDSMDADAYNMETATSAPQSLGTDTQLSDDLPPAFSGTVVPSNAPARTAAQPAAAAAAARQATGANQPPKKKKKKRLGRLL